jgi:phage baseplate assembly protein W
MSDELKTDLRLVFVEDDAGMRIDLAGESAGNAATSSTENLTQALIMRLLVDQGELSNLAHPRYGSRITELIGQTLDRANLELMRRYVKQALLGDPRVTEVLSVSVTPQPQTVGVVDIQARVKAIDGSSADIGVKFNAL